MSEPVVYFIEDYATGHIKIGHTTDVWKRISQLQVSCAGELRLLGIVPGDMSVEAQLHARFAASHLRGEWFRRDPDLDAFVPTLSVPHRPYTTKSRAFWNGMSDGDVSEVVNVSRPMLTQIRLGKRRPSPEMALSLQRATGKSAIALVFGEHTSEVLAVAA